MDVSGTNDLSIMDYGRCPCSGRYNPRFVEVRLNVEGRVIVWASVPQAACPYCGSRIYKMHVLERLEALNSLTR